MRANTANRGHRRILAATLLSVALLSGCAGENLFSLAASVGEVGPTVLITTPGEAFTITVGDSIQIVADINASGGAATAKYSGTYSDSDEAAYTGEEETLGGLTITTVNNFLKAVDPQAEGSVYIVVEVTDIGGATGVDSVKVTIAN